MDAVNSKVYIRVGLVDIDTNALKEKHGPITVEQAEGLTQILTVASPSEG